MSESAFGVEHGGEIAKAKHGLPRSSVLNRAANAAGRGYAKTKQGAEKATSTSFSIKGVGRATARGTQATANGLSRGSLKMANNPGKTGAAVVAGAAGGAGYGGKKLYDREPKKSAPRGM